jgi:UbiD family decarboxylase
MKIDLHVHIHRTSRCAKAEPEHMAQKALEIGLHGLVILDHNYHATKEECEATEALVKGIKIFRGAEINVMDEDIDITDMDEVFWALATRSDPERSIDIIRRCWSTPLDPMVPSGEPPLNSRAVIEACRPYERISSFPPVWVLRKNI